MIPDLTGLTPDVLRDLTNVGTVRRATREVEEGTVDVTFTETDAGLEARASDDTSCLLGAGAFDTWRCDCAAGGSCRHVVRAVLAWRASTPAEAPAEAPAGPAAPAPDGPAPGAPAPEASAAPVVEARTARTAAAARSSYGLVATVQRGTRTTVVLHVPAEATVRFGADDDPRFARCDCGASGCAHLDHALAALAAARVDAGGTALVVVPGEADRTVPTATVVDAWHAWWHQLVGLGLTASAELVPAGVRLATALEDAGLVHPGAVARDLVAQLAHHAARDAEVAPARLVGLAGELEARLRALARPGGVPAALVAGLPDVEQPLGAQRLAGLGAEHLHVGGWSRLRVFVGDVRSGAVRTLTVEATDTEDTLVTARRLGVRSRSGSTYGDWAAATAVLPRSRRRGSELLLPRGTAPVRRGSPWDVPEGSPLLAPRFDAVAVDVDVPGPLAPRGSVAGVGAARVAGVDDVRLDPVEARVTARLHDDTGATARLVLPFSTRARAGAEASLAQLAAGSTTAVAGRWVRRADGLVVRPTLLDGPDGPLVVPLGVVAGPAAHPGADPATDPGAGPTGRAAAPDVPLDPWTRLTTDVTDTLGRLLVVGARRGLAGARRDLVEQGVTAERLGLLRWAGVLRAVAAPSEIDSAALLDVALLLELAQ
ncbi:hypothetical protein [Nocardioides alkalitolerans]|uniref:hypothetical protein n=1 Tax=Nocardioides alkalitolerans TaxID=281714 RepID=UPI0004198EC1|nr:hypothetical protein [Nocardioides alkalitolerans]